MNLPPPVRVLAQRAKHVLTANREHRGHLSRGIAVLALAAGLAACSAPPSEPAPETPEPLPFEPAGPSHAPDPAAAGPFPVGVRTVIWEDGGRRWPDGRARTITVEVWYPAVEAARLPEDQQGASYDIRSVLTADQQAQTASLELPLLHTFAVRDAAPRSDRGAFPLIVFSHGMAGMRWQSTYLTVFLASHGYVVAAPDHEGDRMEDALRGAHEPTTFSLEHRPKDVIYVLNRLARLKEGDPLHGLVDMERVGLAGHSFGALTSLRVPLFDDRIKAIVPQTPPSTDLAWVGFAHPQPFGIPVLIQAARDDQTLKWDEHVAPAWAALSRPRWLLDVVKGGHFTYSDLCAFDLTPILGTVDIGYSAEDVERAMRDGCTEPAPPASVAQPLIRHFAVAFFNAHLRGSEGSLALLSQDRATALAGAEGEAHFTADP